MQHATTTTRHPRFAPSLGALVLGCLLLVGPARGQDLPFDIALDVTEKAIAPDLVVAGSWDVEEAGAVFFSVQKSPALDAGSGRPCGIVDGDAKSDLGETVGYLALTARASEVEAGVADIDGLSGACTVDLDGVADIEGVADIDGLWLRVDLVDLGGGVWSRLVAGDEIAWSVSLDREGWTSTLDAALLDDEIEPGHQPEGPEQTGWVDTPDGVLEVRYVVDEAGLAIFQGDIVLGTADAMDAYRDAIEGGKIRKSATVPSVGFDWPGGTIRFDFGPLIATDPGFATLRARANSAALAWNDAGTNVRITECPVNPALGRPDCPTAGIAPFVRIVPSLDGLCRSHVGRVPGTLFQEMWLSPTGCNRGAILHEFGHALGLYHEHQRQDRDLFLEVLAQNVQGAGGALATLSPGLSIGSHDIDSVMHYSSFTFSADRSRTSTLPTLLQRNRLTEWSAGVWDEVLNTGHSLDELAFGDFGRPGAPGAPDGFPDTLTRNASGWQVVFGNGGSQWQTLNTSTVLQPSVDELQFAEMNGQNGTDIVAHFADINGELRWHVSDGGVAPWRPLAKSVYGMDRVHVADFGQPTGASRDERADVFTVRAGHFQVSWNGTEPWQALEPTTLSFDDLAFGDFGSPPPVAGGAPGPADGITDVLARFDSRWQISFGGDEAWHPTRRSGFGVDRLLVADIGSRPPGTGHGTPGPADGQADLVATFGGRLWVSYGAQSRWRRVGRMRADSSLLRLGNRIGDDAAEVLSDGVFSWQNRAPSTGDIAGVDFIYP